MTAATISPPRSPQVPRGQTVLGKLRRQPMTMAAVLFIAMLGLAALLAPVLSPYRPHDTDYFAILQTPSPAHLLGTDDLGRDILSRMLYATRASLLACLQAVGLAVFVGVIIGLLAGYFGGWIDRLLMIVIDSLLAIPGLLLALALVGALGPGLVNASFALSIIFVPVFARITRIQAAAVNQEPYMEASRSIGLTHRRSVLRHLLPNTAAPLIVQIFITLGVAIVAEGAMSYLGMSIQPPEASWGNMLQRSFSTINEAPWLIFIPGALMTLTVLAFQVIGDGLNRSFALDTRSET
ncbi:ABC transporter permease [Sphaerimonospora thailandensis]|uniref:Peptide ABC transporter permease n=1 Tax=Sphaerimonospora thailandensis TaxID=795644 RepID=A0A8J3W1P2_9ACTN|nr:ABC transporter permease [Sphaerimonospora thailandensis]GIH72410.1 peptide ABC transporter permease [Sphaerimonospora thailandensis]